MGQGKEGQLYPWELELGTFPGQGLPAEARRWRGLGLQVSS